MKKSLLILGIVIALAVIVAGSVYAWNANHSDVGRATPTPDTTKVRYHVMGTSMDPTIKDGDWLLADTGIRDIKRGDVVILPYPKDKSKIYCRRVAAIGGDRVVMRYYSNVKITTVYTSAHPEGLPFPENVKPASKAYGEYESVVQPGSLYVVGDNTVPGGSYDSDEWGLLPAKEVIGVVVERLEPEPRKF